MSATKVEKGRGRRVIVEEAMEPDKPIVRRYLEDADYPARQQELLSTAESNGAPTALIERLQNLPKDAEFSSLHEVVEALESQDQSHDHALRSRRGNP
jgi:hypothetical protein